MFVFYGNKQGWLGSILVSVALMARLFLLRQGEEPRGIMAAGWATSTVYEGPHWDRERRERGDTALRVDLRFDRVLNPEADEILTLDKLQTGPPGLGELGDTGVRKLVKGELATPDTWEIELSKGGDKKAAWSRLLAEDKLGGLAMLRNVRSMTQAGVDADEIRGGLRKVKAGRLLPINFIASARHNPQFEPELEGKFFECFVGREKLGGKTVILVDVSGSMDAPLSGKSELNRMDVACSLAMIGREMFDDLRVFTFSNSLVEVPGRRGFGLRDAIVRSQPHGGTELGKAVKALPGRDRLIVITDEQSHDPVPQMKGYMINVASNRNGVGYGQWLHIDGWSDKVLDYIVKYEANARNDA